MKILAMIPARLGSQRLKQKNLRSINGKTLLQLAIEKCKNTKVFDEVWVNSESEIIGNVALENGAKFHKRPEELANNSATSEDFIYEFLKSNDCTHVVQVHSIAPLLSQKDIIDFVEKMMVSKANVFLSYEPIQIECAYKNTPINFTFDEKTNSQDLDLIQRISWSITGWLKDEYITNYEIGKCASYAGDVDFIPISKLASHVIKVEEDLKIAQALYDLVVENGG
ncbi:MAG: cytidyltransferase [Balneola sp.]|nr:MAG: cytidyltransferase [Balneola sp.]